MTICNLCQPCRECGGPAWCEGEPGQIKTPCPHFEPLCENCRIEGCADCRLEAEMNMYRSGEYNPDADPSYNPKAKVLDDAYWARAPREADAAVFRWTDDGGAA